MDIKEAVRARHSVRQFKDDPIPEEIRAKLQELVEECNAESGLNIQVIYDDPECFQTFLAKYGKFQNVNHYLALVGKKADDLEEKAGYYGEKLVIALQQMGLNTCWVGGTYGKGKCKADAAAGEKLVCVIAFGYGANKGVKHRSKPVQKLCNVAEADMPLWFKDGLVAAILAPTAVNQQKFFVELDGDEAVITSKGGFFSKVDLGIVKYHFEAVSGHKCRS